MPDNNHNSELMRQLREQLEKIKEPIGVPVHKNVDAALNLIADLITAVDEQNNQQEVDLTEIRAAIQQLQTALQTNTAADEADHAILIDLRDRLAILEQRVRDLPAEIDQKIADALGPVNTEIGNLDRRETARHSEILDKIAELEAKIRSGGITEEEAQALIDRNLAPIRTDIQGLHDQDAGFNTRLGEIENELERLETLINTKITAAQADERIDAALLPLKQKDQAHDEGIAGLDSRVTTLENKPAGISEARAREIAAELLAPVKADLKTLLDQDLDGRLTDLNRRVEALERQPPGGGISEAEVRRIVTAEIQNLRTEINTVLAQKADKTDLALKADKADLALKADKADLVLKADKADVDTKLALKADKSDVDDKLALKADKSDVDTKLALKADKTDVDDKLALKADKSDVDTKLALKADKSDVDTKLALKADKADVDTKLALKADKTDVDDKLALKADKTDVDTKLALKADKTDVDTKLALKADKSDVDTKLALKADKSDVDTKLALKADKTDVDDKLALKADKSDVDDKLALKADKSDVDTKLALKADKSDVDDKLALKADKTYVDDKLALKADKTDVDDKLALKADKTYVDDKLALKADKTEILRIDQEIEDMREEWLQEDQNSPGVRLARLALQGWGIVGGLEIHSDDKDYISITPGIGVTPAGELVIEPGLEPVSPSAPNVAKTHPKKKVKEHEDASEWSHKPSPCDPPKPGNLLFSHYLPYTDAAKYDYFKKADGTTYEVWILLQPSPNLPPEAIPLTPHDDQTVESPFLADKIILLLPVDDKLLYLLMRRQDVLEKNCCLPHQCKSADDDNPDYLHEDAYSEENDYITDDEVWACLHPAIRLPEIPLFRFGYYTEPQCKVEELDATEFPQLASVNDFYKTWYPIVEDAIGRLEKGVRKLIRRYHPMLFPLLDIQTFRDKLEILSDKWTKFTVSNDPPNTLADEVGTKYYAQYFYDWLRDLIAGYHELRWAVIELMNDLRPYTLETLAKQHKHLFLGPAQQPDSNGLDMPLRDYFHQPPIYNGNAARLETCRLYYRRLFAMIEGFYLENYAPKGKPPGWCFQENEDGLVVEQKPRFDRLRITPGKSYIHPLSEQSIPYYYPIIDHPQSLQHYWNYRRAKTRSTDRLLSYHATDAPANFPSYTKRREAIRPLYYSLDPHDFYRIEGHIGKSAVSLYPATDDSTPLEYDVYEALQYLVKKHNLDFKVMRVTISELQLPEGGSGNPHNIQNAAGEGEQSLSFRLDLLGAEHLGGVPKGGTFILVYEDAGSGQKKQKTSKSAGEEPAALPRVIADFSLPYRCSLPLLTEI